MEGDGSSANKRGASYVVTSFALALSRDSLACKADLRSSTSSLQSSSIILTPGRVACEVLLPVPVPCVTKVPCVDASVLAPVKISHLDALGLVDVIFVIVSSLRPQAGFIKSGARQKEVDLIFTDVGTHV